MARLTPKAEDLVRATRSAFKPTSEDRAHVFQALLPSVGGSQAAEWMTGRAHAPAAARGLLVKVSAVLVGLGVVGGGSYLLSRSERQQTKPAPTVPAKKTPEAHAPPDDVPESPAPAAQAEVSEKRTPVSVHSDKLAQEVAILSRAGAELHAGRPADALQALDEHQRKFPGGVLTQERTAARVQALCALGRMKEARSELARLTRTAPQSPHVARARKACGIAPPGEE